MHDFPGDALGRAVPYGVYDLTNNRGLIYLGTSGDTPAFAADAIAAWWQTGRAGHLANRDHFLLLADAGGSNSCRIARLERTPASAGLRSLRFDGDRVPLSDWMLEMESDRATDYSAISAATGPACRCAPGTPCWPSFVAPRPPAA